MIPSVVVSATLLEISSKVPTFQIALGRSLDGLLDFVVAGPLLNAAGQVDDRHIGGGNTHRHAGELAIEVRNDLTDCLRRARRAGNDVLGSGTASAPVFGGRAVHGLLGGSIGMDGRHEAFDDGIVVVNDFGKGCEAVGRARGVGDDLDVGLVRFLVDTHNKHGSIGRWCGDDNLLRASLQVCLGLLGRGEDAGGLYDVVRTSLAPRDVCRVLFGIEADGLAVDGQVVAVNLDFAFELPMDSVIFEHISLR